nr:hypothetical protein [uncultured Kingella sp.]
MLGLGGVVRGATREMAKYWAELCGNVRGKMGAVLFLMRFRQPEKG